SSTWATTFVLYSGSSSRSTTSSSPSRSLAERALRSACLLAFLGIRSRQSRGLGPKTTPPPRQRGDRILPCLARPKPFCRQGFRPPPRTSPRVLVDAVPARRLAR